MYKLVSYQLNDVASVYGSCSYSGSTYNDNSCQTTTSTTSSSSSPLVNTGFIILSVVTIAVVIIFVALVVRFVRKPQKPVAGSTAVSAKTPGQNR